MKRWLIAAALGLVLTPARAELITVTPAQGGVTAQMICAASGSTELLFNNAGACDGVTGWTTNGTTALTGGAATTLSIGGATIGTNNLAVTGNALIGGNVALLNTSTITFGVAQRAVISSPADGRIMLTNNSGVGFNRLHFGGQLATDPAIIITGSVLRITGGDATNGAGLMIGGTVLTLSPAEIGITVRTTPSGTAPGGTGLKLAVQCGTTAGTAKLVAYAGTSVTATTVMDNIGAVVTGC